MAYNLGTVATKVQTRIKDTGFSLSTIKEFINNVQDDVFNDYRLSFMETVQSYTLAVGESDITNGSGLPSNFDQAIALVITTNGSEQYVPYKPIRELLQLYPDTTAVSSNVPMYWYKYGNTIKVFPAPNLAYTAQLYYIKKATQMDEDADVPEIPSNFEELLVYGAAYRVMEVKDNYDKAAVLEKKYLDKLDQLVSRYSQRQSGKTTGQRINRVRMSQGL